MLDSVVVNLIKNLKNKKYEYIGEGHVLIDVFDFGRTFYSCAREPGKVFPGPVILKGIFNYSRIGEFTCEVCNYSYIDGKIPLPENLVPEKYRQFN